MLFTAPLTVLCDAETAARLKAPADLAGETLLRSYRSEEWPAWFEAAGVETPPLIGPVFDSRRLDGGGGAGRAAASRWRRRSCSKARAPRPFDAEVTSAAIG